MIPTSRSVRQPVEGADTDWRTTGLWLAGVAALISGMAVFLNARAVGHFASPTVYTTGKNLVAGVLLVVVAIGATTRAQRPRAALSHRGVPVALGVIAVVGGSVAFVLFFEGLARASSTDAAFVHKTLVVWVAVLATVFLRERITMIHVVAVALLVAGHAALAGGVGALEIGVGEVMVLLATLCWAIELIIVKRIIDVVPASQIAAVRIGGGSILLVAWLLATGALGELVGLDAAQWGWLLATGAVLTAFVSCWFAALARAPVVDVTAILVFGAVVTGLLEVGVGHEPVGDRAVGWMLIAIGALVIAARDRLVGPEAPPDAASAQ